MASSHLETAIRINIDTREGVGNVEALNAAVKKTLTELGRGADFDALEKLRQQAAEGKLNVAELDDGLRDLWLVYQKLSSEAADKDLLGLRAHQEIQEEIDATRAAYERLKASGKLTSAELAQAALKTEERVRALESQTNGWADSLFRAKMALIGAAGAGAGLVKIAGAGIQFESAMADVAKVVDGTQAQMAALSGRLKEMSTAMPIAASGLAQIAAAGGQLGVPIEKLETFVDLAAKMSTAFGMSADEAGQAVAKLTNIFGLPIEQVEALGDAINTLGNTTAATESSIVEVLTRIGGTAKQFGLTAEQASALASTMLSMGVSAQVAGTGINALLNKLQTASVQGKDFQDALATMGISAQQLAADIQNNPQAALTEFLRTLETLDKASRAEILTRLFGAEFQDDIARLLGGLGQYEQALTRVGDSAQTAGAMQQEFMTRTQTTEAQIEMLKNSVQAVAITLGEAMLPVLRAAITTAGGVVEGLRAVVETVPGVAAIATAFATAAAAGGTLKFTLLALNVAGVKSFTQIATAAGALNEKISLVTLGAKNLTSFLNRATLVFSAWQFGVEVGEALRQKFAEVELAGVAVAEAIAKIGATMVYVKDYVFALFTDDTIDAAAGRYLDSLEEIHAGYADVAQAALDARNKSTEAAEASAQASAQTGEAAKDAAVQILTSAQAANNLQSALKAAGEAGKEAGDALRAALTGFDLGDTSAIHVLIAEMDTVGARAVAMREQIQAALSGMSTAEMAAFTEQLQAAFDNGDISARQFAEVNEQIVSASLQKLGLTASEALGRIGDPAREAIGAFETLAARIGGTEDSAEAKMQALARAGEAVISKLKTGAELDAFVARLHEMAANGEISAEVAERLTAKVEEQRAALKNADAAAESHAEKLRKAADAARDEAQALTQSSSAAVQLARAQLDLARAGGDANEIREASVALAQAEAANADAVAAAKQKEADAALADAQALQAELLAKGQLDAAAQTQIRNAFAAAEAKQVEAEAARVAASAASAQAQAASGAGEASAQAAEKTAAAHGKAASAAESSAGAQVISWQSIARAGRITADELNQYADAIQGAWMRTKDLITSKSLYFNAQGVGQKIQEEMRAAIEMAKSVDNAIASLQSGHATLRDMQQAAGIAQSAVGKVGDERLSALRSALQDAQNRMRELSATARDALGSVRDELDQLRGNTEALEKRRGEEKLRELHAKLAEAQAQGNTQAAGDLAEAIRLQKELNAEKLKAAREEKAERNRDTRNTGSASSTGSASAGGGVQTVRTVNVRLGNTAARVIADDEAALLRMIEQARTAS